MNATDFHQIQTSSREFQRIQMNSIIQMNSSEVYGIQLNSNEFKRNQMNSACAEANSIEFNRSQTN